MCISEIYMQSVYNIQRTSTMYTVQCTLYNYAHAFYTATCTTTTQHNAIQTKDNRYLPDLRERRLSLDGDLDLSFTGDEDLVENV